MTLRGLVFVRSLTTNIPLDLSAYSHFYYSEELYHEFDCKSLQFLKDSHCAKRKVITKCITDLESYIKKPIKPISKITLQKQVSDDKLNSLDLYLPLGQQSELTNVECAILNVIRAKEQQYALQNHTCFYRKLRYTPEPYTPRTHSEVVVHSRLKEYLAHNVADYSRERSKIHGNTAKISHYLALGVISFEAVMTLVDEIKERSTGLEEFRRQLSWVLYCKLKARTIADWAPQKTQISAIKDDLKAYATGTLTALSGLDGAVLQKVNTHLKRLHNGEHISNRLRLILSYVLIKTLKIPWQYGQMYFRCALIDYHPAVNRYNWYAQNKNRFLSGYNLERQFRIYEKP